MTAEPGTPTPDIFDPRFVKGVFDRCGVGYRRWSAIASFGFVVRWRRQCVAALPHLPPGAVGLDLMAGTGEIWPHLLRRFPDLGAITAVDISATMHAHALDRLHRTRLDKVTFLEADVLATDLAPASADFIIATFGLKTFSGDQQRRLAHQIARTLKPGGGCALIEASDPKAWDLRPLYRLYLDYTLPLIERLFLRGAQDFAMLGVYTRHFGDCRHFADCLTEAGLEVRFLSDFFGCATGVAARRPGPEKISA